MDGRTLLGALIRFLGFGGAVLQSLQVLQSVIGLVGIAMAAAKQPMAQDAAKAAAENALVPLLFSLVLLALSVLILRGGDKIAEWAYSPRKGRGAPSAANTAAKPAAAKRAPAKTTSSDS
jgi:hypothetical protein